MMMFQSMFQWSLQMQLLKSSISDILCILVDGEKNWVLHYDGIPSTFSMKFMV